MCKDDLGRQGRLLVLAMTAFLLVTCAASCKAGRLRDANAPASDSRTDPNQKPIIIWFHSIHRDSTSTLRNALSSGLITHVIVKTAHRKDFVLEVFKKQEPMIPQCIDIAKRFNVKVIWSRSVWPYYVNDDVRLSYFFDAEYYINEIRILRQEAKALGAEYTSLDTEVYGYSPMQQYWRNRFELTPQQERSLKSAVDTVISTAGQVDFIYPGGYVRGKHPANVLAGLGKIRIATDTYLQDDARLQSIRYKYDIFGAYVNTVRSDGEYKWPYFLVSDIFNRSDLWAGKKGVMLYPKEHNSEAVARELVAYSRTLPLKGTGGAASDE
jgi:hypothetical protein